MSSQETPVDQQALRSDIAETRAELGETVAALSAKTDVRARASDAVGQVTDQAREKARAVGDQVKAGAASVRDSLAEVEVPAVVRRPLPVAVLVGAAVGVALVVFWWRRR
jgi:hypothetical protein